MANENETYSLPVGPSDLCFDTNEFVKKTFSADKFLQNHSKKANLETMRDDLGIYLKVLRSAMIELINKDYADFVNLSSNLIGLDKAINGIQVPLGQLKEEVLQVKLSLDETIADIDSHLETRREIQTKKHSLQNLSRVQKSLTKLSSLLQLDNAEPEESGEKLLVDSALVERAASEYNQLQFCISKCTKFLVPYHNTQTEKIRSLLISSLDEMFLKGVRTQDAEGMARCLRIYVTMDKVAEVETLFRREIVSPVMNDIISESSLQSDPRGLQGVYSRILEFVHKHMKVLLELTTEGDKPPVIKGFDFLVKSYWTEVEQRLEMHLSSIYAPGNPEMFYQRYSETLVFLEKLETMCGSQAKVKMLFSHPQYVSFLQRWNLPVYFQIRFQEIAGSLEGVLMEDETAASRTNGNGGFQLLATSSTWDCLLRCWVDGVYLRQLTHRFWKMSLQIIARYYTWTESALEKKWPTSSTSSSAAISSVAAADAGPSENKKLAFLVSLYTDIERLAERLPEFLATASERMTNLSPQNQALVAASLKESEAQLLSRLPSVTQRILDEVSSQSLVHLRQVSDIPRLFRRTNREVPTKPCSYVAALLSPPVAFHLANRSAVKGEVLQGWLASIFAAITRQFLVSVNDVLTSVQKTEESLRRLKKIRDRSAGAGAGEGRGGAGDDDKIRQQLAIDVLGFCEGVEGLGVERAKVDKLDDLVSLVEGARTKSDATKQ